MGRRPKLLSRYPNDLTSGIDLEFNSCTKEDDVSFECDCGQICTRKKRQITATLNKNIKPRCVNCRNKLNRSKGK